MTDARPLGPADVGEIVHLIHGGTCYAAIITAVAEDVAELLPFHPLGLVDVLADRHPYVSLSSARPTSGWHYREEHDAD